MSISELRDPPLEKILTDIETQISKNTEELTSVDKIEDDVRNLNRKYEEVENLKRDISNFHNQLLNLRQTISDIPTTNKTDLNEKIRNLSLKDEKITKEILEIDDLFREKLLEFNKKYEDDIYSVKSERIKSEISTDIQYSFPLPLKIPNPSFSGTKYESASRFLRDCERFKEAKNGSEEWLLRQMHFLLQDSAQYWWDYERDFVKTWQEFKVRFLSAFLSPNFKDAFESELKERKQHPSEDFVHYSVTLRNLAKQAYPDITEREIIEYVIKNSLPEFRTHARHRSFETFSKLMEFGKQHEVDLYEKKNQFVPNQNKSYNYSTHTHRCNCKKFLQ